MVWHVSVSQVMWSGMFQSVRGCGLACFSRSGDVVWHVSVDQVMWSGMFQSIRGCGGATTQGAVVPELSADGPQGCAGNHHCQGPCSGL